MAKNVPLVTKKVLGEEWNYTNTACRFRASWRSSRAAATKSPADNVATQFKYLHALGGIEMRLSAAGLFVGMLFGACLATPSLASDESDVMAVVKSYLSDMNTGNVAGFTKRCAAEAIIIDDFPPHVWQGANACMDWLNAFLAYDAKMGITPEAVTIGDPRVLSVDGDYAYIVLPAGYKYTQKGKPINETNSVWTIVLKKSGDGWRVTGWSWSQGE